MNSTASTPQDLIPILRSKLFSLGIAAIALAGCQPVQNESSPAPLHRAAHPLPVTTLRVSGWQSQPTEKRLLETVIRQFEHRNPDIKIKYEVINSEYMDVIKTRLIGDVAPDVFYLEAFEAPLLMKSGVLEPLDGYITPAFNLPDFQPTMLNAFRYKGHWYGVPKDFSTLALIYNKTLFAEAGIAQPPRTWEALLQVSKRLTRDRNADGKIDQYGFSIAPELARQLFLMRAFGGRLTNAQGYATFAEPKSLRGLALTVNQYQHDRTAAQPSDVGTTGGSDMLGQGKAAMAIEGPWAIPYFQETFPKLSIATAEIPTVNGKHGTMAYTVAYVINRKSAHKAAAWRFIAYLTSKTGMKTWASQGLALPTRKSLLTELGYDRDPIYAPFAKGATYATIWQAGETLPTIRTNFNNQFISALLGKQSLKNAMQKAQDTANREIYWSQE